MARVYYGAHSRGCSAMVCTHNIQATKVAGLNPFTCPCTACQNSLVWKIAPERNLANIKQFMKLLDGS
jgi:hypothetical protein